MSNFRRRLQMNITQKPTYKHILPTELLDLPEDWKFELPYPYFYAFTHRSTNGEVKVNVLVGSNPQVRVLNSAVSWNGAYYTGLSCFEPFDYIIYQRTDSDNSWNIIASGVIAEPTNMINETYPYYQTNSNIIGLAYTDNMIRSIPLCGLYNKNRWSNTDYNFWWDGYEFVDNHYDSSVYIVNKNNVFDNKYYICSLYDIEEKIDYRHCLNFYPIINILSESEDSKGWELRCAVNTTKFTYFRCGGSSYNPLFGFPESDNYSKARSMGLIYDCMTKGESNAFMEIRARNASVSCVTNYIKMWRCKPRTDIITNPWNL